MADLALVEVAVRTFPEVGVDRFACAEDVRVRVFQYVSKTRYVWSGHRQ